MTTIWYKDPVAAFGPRELHMFFPTRQMSLQQQLNSVVRLSAYWSVAVTLICKDVRYMLPLVLVALITVAIHETYAGKTTYSRELFLDRGMRPCVRPTDNNPHMNVMLGDYTKRPNRASACDVSDPLVQLAVAAKTTDLPHDDPFSDGRTDRQFYTMPSTTIPNDQKGYRDFLYGDVMKPTIKSQHF